MSGSLNFNEPLHLFLENGWNSKVLNLKATKNHFFHKNYCEL